LGQRGKLRGLLLQRGHRVEGLLHRAAHPREDHLIPLMVVVGAARDELGAVTYHQTDFAGGLTASSFRFGNVPEIV